MGAPVRHPVVAGVHKHRPTVPSVVPNQQILKYKFSLENKPTTTSSRESAVQRYSNQFCGSTIIIFESESNFADNLGSEWIWIPDPAMEESETSVILIASKSDTGILLFSW